jgi:hypothetical protein
MYLVSAAPDPYPRPLRAQTARLTDRQTGLCFTEQTPTSQVVAALRGHTHSPRRFSVLQHHHHLWYPLTGTTSNSGHLQGVLTIDL